MAEPACFGVITEFTASRFGADFRVPMEKEFCGDSDRACGILTATMVENSVESAIKNAMKPDISRSRFNALFDFDGPIGTFSAKIDVACRFGLFGPKTNHDLHLIRLIRDEFAQCPLPFRFDMAAVADVCARLLIPDTEHRILTPVFAGAPHAAEIKDEATWADETHPKSRFFICCHSIAYWLLALAEGANRARKLP